jgi:hypothetical protein
MGIGNAGNGESPQRQWPAGGADPSGARCGAILVAGRRRWHAGGRLRDMLLLASTGSWHRQPPWHLCEMPLPATILFAASLTCLMVRHLHGLKACISFKIISPCNCSSGTFRYWPTVNWHKIILQRYGMLPAARLPCLRSVMWLPERAKGREGLSCSHIPGGRSARATWEMTVLGWRSVADRSSLWRKTGGREVWRIAGGGLRDMLLPASLGSRCRRSPVAGHLSVL